MRRAGLRPEWTPRELRHCFVPLLSDRGIPLQTIAVLVGHSSQKVTYKSSPKSFCPDIS
ncbi:hypothetical protein [Streptomyces collinus]|uniref:hypothetical protein n=1 Tax=Streptomyces collinus TaxID=42684 RepID=UPI00363CD448